MATVELDDDAVADMVRQDLEFHLEHRHLPALEPELVNALMRVLDFYSSRSQFEEFKEKLAWKERMENQV